MESMKLDVQTRDSSFKAKELLAQNLIPIEFYGKGEKNRSLQVDYQTFRRLFRVAGGNTVIELTVDGKDKANILVHDVKYHPVRDTITHVDLMSIDLTKKITARIPLNFVGISKAVKELGGVLTHSLSDVEIECLPGDLIHSLDVDISTLDDFHSSVRVSDLVVPANIEILNDAGLAVASVSATKTSANIDEEGEEAADAESSEEKTEEAAK